MNVNEFSGKTERVVKDREKTREDIYSIANEASCSAEFPEGCIFCE